MDKKILLLGQLIMTNELYTIKLLKTELLSIIDSLIKDINLNSKDITNLDNYLEKQRIINKIDKLLSEWDNIVKNS